MDGNNIYVGDTVEVDGNKTVIEWGSYRDLFGGGLVYGYYVPDFCRLVKTDEK